MENLSVMDFLLNPTVIVTIFIGASALLLVYILRLFKIEHVAEEKNQSETISSSHSERKKESSSGKSKKKSSGDHRWSTRTDKQGFTSPWLLKTLKSHTGQVLNIDYSSSGKYLASCGEEDPDPDPDLDMNTSSGSECNKENSRPPSADPSPRTKGLSRRQRKNRRREDSSPDSKKKLKNMETPKKNQLEPLKQCLKLNISERDFYDLLHKHLLTYEQLFMMGYPVQSPNYNNAVVFFNFNKTVFSQQQQQQHPQFDVNAREFVPSKRHILSNYDMNGQISSSSSDSSEIDSEESSGSEPDLAFYSDNRKSAIKDQGIQRTCVRCGRGFFTMNKEYLTQERCTYHWGKLQSINKNVRKYATDMMQYTCCQGKYDTIGCTTCKLHVWNGVVSGLNGPCEGFVKTRQKKSIPLDGNYGVYALDCEMCYTVAGLEVTKVTVVGMDGRLVYDSYVKPKNEIIDYNTRFSGITAKDLNKPGATKVLKEVQNDLRGFINANTILIGHGLENDLRALKLIHKTIVDTACSFPHYNGLPYKRSLRSLVSSYLKREVQGGPNGHNSYEDACACMELMLYKVRKENKGYL